MYNSLSEIEQISKKIDCCAYQQHQHYTINPIPDMIYSSTEPTPRKSQNDDEKQKYIQAIIDKFCKKGVK